MLLVKKGVEAGRAENLPSLPGTSPWMYFQLVGKMMPRGFHKSEWKGDENPEDPLNLMSKRRTRVCHPRCLLFGWSYSPLLLQLPFEL